MSKAFRPQEWNRKFKLKCRRNFGLKLKNSVGESKWMNRSFINSHIHRVCKQLHYLADHSPHTVSIKWQSAWNKFRNRYRKLL